MKYKGMKGKGRGRERNKKEGRRGEVGKDRDDKKTGVGEGSLERKVMGCKLVGMI